MVERINPQELYNSTEFGFSHASVSAAGRIITCAGQVAWDAERNIVGAGDLAAQTRQALKNLKTVLAAAGASPAHVTRIRTYVVDHTPDKLGPVSAELAAFWEGGVPAPNTWIGVCALALPDFLIEIEADAVVP